jgi:hypothetical protein
MFIEQDSLSESDEELEYQWQKFCELHCSAPHPDKGSFYWKIAKRFFERGRVFENKRKFKD